MSNIDLELIRILHENNREYISGEEISRRLAVSRTTIWKHIKVLREKGYKIDSSTNKGYLLQSVPERLIGEEVMLELDTEKIGKDIIVFDELDSTNEKGKELARAGSSSGTVIAAEKQIAGKGRLGRKWHSAAGEGLWFSIILRPDIKPVKSPFLTIAASLAVHEAIIETVKCVCKDYNWSRIKIKWPNDILIGEKKVAGILAEMSADMDKVKYAVVGIGINVNQNSFPESINERAISLTKEFGVEVNRQKLLRRLLISFERYYKELHAGEEDELLAVWKKKLDLIGKGVVISGEKKSYTGTVVDISGQGELILRDDEDKLHRFWAGDVSLRRNYY